MTFAAMEHCQPPDRATQPSARRAKPHLRAAGPGGLLALQRLAGNAGVASWLASSPIQRPQGVAVPADQPVVVEESSPPRLPHGQLDDVNPTGVSGLQRTIGDGHDLSNPRFAGTPDLEACFDNERTLKVGASGPAVTKVQQAMVDIGLSLPRFGVDGKFGAETKSRVQVFQRSATIKDDGIIGPITMGEFDRRIPHGSTPPPPPAPPVTLTSQTVVTAPDGGSRARLDVGPGELVDVTASTAVGWAAAAGTLSAPTGPTTRWAAPEKGAVTITATPAGGAPVTITFQVVPPDSITMTRAIVNPIPPGQAGADMLCDVDFGHRDVSFSRVQWLEEPGPPSGVNGYFLVGPGAAMDLAHHPNPDFVTIRADNHFLYDHCGSGFPLAPPFLRMLPPPPYFGGGWFWSVPNRYRIVGLPATSTFFVATTQTFSLDSLGTTSVSKQGASITRTQAGAVT